ncbi:MAG: DeoR/GlpR family DNA-binding transcription regulator [Planctomycetota bacterium]
MNTRQKKIMQILLGGEMSIKALADQLGVVEMTIRRDLDRLADAGRITRTRGGATLSGQGRIEFRFTQRRETLLDRKHAIADRAMEFIEPGMSVCIDTGTTTLEIARKLADPAAPENLSIITSSLAVISELYAIKSTTLILLGGILRKDNPDLYGKIAEDNLSRFHIDLAFLGADALGPAGTYATDSEIARLSQAMIAHSDQCVLVADSSKFSARAHTRIADWQQFDAFITDSLIDDSSKDWLKAQEVNVILAPVETTPVANIAR